CLQGSAGPCAGAEIAQREMCRRCVLAQPGTSHQDAIGEQINVEHVAPIFLLVRHQQINQHRGEPSPLKMMSHEAVTRTEPATSAAMREQDHAFGSRREAEHTRKSETLHCNGDRLLFVLERHTSVSGPQSVATSRTIHCVYGRPNDLTYVIPFQASSSVKTSGINEAMA